MIRNIVLTLGAGVILSCTSALAANVRADYDHDANFAGFKTYSWGAVTTKNPLNVNRIKAAVDTDLQADGWRLLPNGGAATIVVTGDVKTEQEAETMYDGLGGGYGLGGARGGWGWGRGGWGGGFGGGFGDGGFGEATTTLHDQRVGHLVVDIFNESNHALLFRGVSDNELGNDAKKNAKQMTSDISGMLKKLPQSAKL
jgi:hypothetical protein